MIDIEFEFLKGILFIRLSGNLNKSNAIKIYEDISECIFDNEIRNIVINFENVKNIDYTGINILIYNSYLCKNNFGNLSICNVSKKQINYLKKFNIIADELTALRSFVI